MSRVGGCPPDVGAVLKVDSGLGGGVGGRAEAGGNCRWAEPGGSSSRPAGRLTAAILLPLRWGAPCRRTLSCIAHSLEPPLLVWRNNNNNHPAVCSSSHTGSPLLPLHNRQPPGQTREPWLAVLSPGQIPSSHSVSEV